MERYNTKTLVKGDFLNNDEVDEACAKRLLILCEDYGTEGLEIRKKTAQISFLFQLMFYLKQEIF